MKYELFEVQTITYTIKKNQIINYHRNKINSFLYILIFQYLQYFVIQYFGHYYRKIIREILKNFFSGLSRLCLN